MRPSYRSTFSVGRDGAVQQGEAIFAGIAKDVLAWSCSRPGFRVPAGLSERLLETNDRAAIGDGASIETIGVEDDDQRLWGLRLVHADEDDLDVEWHTEICLARRADGSTTFSCTNSYGAARGLYLMRRRAASRPRIVRDVLEKYGGRAGYPLTTRALPLRTDDAKGFVSSLRDPARERPLVFLSAANFTDAPVADPVSIADRLAGLAHVVVAENRFVAFKLDDLLPRRLNCWNGAVRVYMPGVAPSDSPFQHPVWSPEDVRDASRRLKGGFAQLLLGELAESAALATPKDHLQWEDVEGVLRRRALNDLRRRGDRDEMLKLYEEDNDRLSKQLKEAALRQEELAKQLTEARGQADSWRQAYQEQQRGGPAATDGEIALPVASVSEAFDRAKATYADRIIFAPNSRSEIDKNPYEDAEGLMSALDWMGTTYFLSRTGQRTCPDFDVSIREECGWTYRSHQSDVTMSKYKPWYTTKVGDDTIWLHEHIGVGHSKDARRTIRIAFRWDATRKRVVLGYIGQHQETDAT